MKGDTRETDGLRDDTPDSGSRSTILRRGPSVRDPFGHLRQIQQLRLAPLPQREDTYWDPTVSRGLKTAKESKLSWPVTHGVESGISKPTALFADPRHTSTKRITTLGC